MQGIRLHLKTSWCNNENWLFAVERHTLEINGQDDVNQEHTERTLDHCDVLKSDISLVVEK